MGVSDLVFKLVETDAAFYEPAVLVDSVPRQISITNYGESTVDNLGIYAIPSTILGGVDYPSDFPPETDFEDLMTWGSLTEAGVNAFGGLKLEVPQTGGGITTTYVSRTAGSSFDTKLTMQDIAPNEEVIITFTVETPPATPARRVHVGIAVDQD
jgi:hypothetical protein